MKLRVEYSIFLNYYGSLHSNVTLSVKMEYTALGIMDNVF